MSRQKKNNRQYTYFIKSKYFPESYIDKQFADRGNWVKYDQPLHRVKKPIDFVYLDELFYTNPRYYLLPAMLKNTVNDDKRNISLKHNLVRNLLSDPIGRKYVMPQYELDLYKLFIDKNTTETNNLLHDYESVFSTGKVHIFKPISGKAGMGIEVFNDFKPFKKYCEDVVARQKKSWGSGNPEKEPLRIWVLQEYITNPLLITKKTKDSDKEQQYKFHIRQAYLYQPKPKQSFYRPLNICPIAIAEKPFIHGDWMNKDIHDTHFHGAIQYLWRDVIKMIPSLANNKVALQSIENQLNELYNIVNTKYNNARCYPETKHCFEIFGADIMITDTFDIKVLEINAGIGISGDIEIKRDIFDNVFSNIIDVYYPPKNKVTPPANLYVPITLTSGIPHPVKYATRKIKLNSNRQIKNKQTKKKSDHKN